MRQALLAGLSFSLWPFLARLSGAPNAWVGPVVMVSTTLCLWIATRAEIVAAPSLGRHMILLLFLAGALNSFGMMNYGEVLSDSLGPLSSLLPIIYITMLGVAVIAGVLFLGEPLTWIKVGGAIAGAIAVFLFSR